MDVKEELRYRRILANLTQTAVAKEAGVHPVKLCQYERGVHTPSPQIRQRILAAIDRLAHKEDAARGGGNY